jgi:hypothetical protein
MTFASVHAPTLEIPPPAPAAALTAGESGWKRGRIWWCNNTFLLPSLFCSSSFPPADGAWRRVEVGRGGATRAGGGLLLLAKFLSGGGLLLQTGSDSGFEAERGGALLLGRPSLRDVRPPAPPGAGRASSPRRLACNATSSATKCGLFTSSRSSVAVSSPLRAVRTFYKCGGGKRGAVVAMRVGDSRNSRRVVVENEAALWVEKEGGGGDDASA